MESAGLQLPVFIVLIKSRLGFDNVFVFTTKPAVYPPGGFERVCACDDFAEHRDHATHVPHVSVDPARTTVFGCVVGHLHVVDLWRQFGRTPGFEGLSHGHVTFRDA